ncbi:MAG TPA: DUF3105 domain-containing protein [Natronosporangium sp.]|jgi:hypothetical protein
MTATTGRGQLGWRVCYLTLIAVLLVLPSIGPLQRLTGSVGGSVAQEARPAPCLPGEAVEIMDSPHISEAEAADAEYNSLPPTSGPHFPFTISPGVYRDPVPEGLTVHAMEHGRVVIQYAPSLPDDEVRALESLARRYIGDVILAPYPPLPEGIALTAWGRIDLLDEFDEGRIVAFVEALRGRYDHGWTTDDDCP